MKKILIALLIGFIFFSCADTEPSIYTGNRISYQLFQASTFDYSGSVDVKELVSGELEFNIALAGPKGYESSNFPAHLHFGTYDSPDAVIASMLSPVNGGSLKSTTLIRKLSDGTDLNFESLKDFSGHIKVHLAGEGPDYKVILVAGNVGQFASSSVGFDQSKMAVCGNSF